jgi:hypothetical protein
MFEGSTAWVVNHRDRRLVRIDAEARTARVLGVLPGDAPERIAAANGSLWITGRGTDLDVHGLAWDGTAVWLADNTNGVLYRIAR